MKKSIFIFLPFFFSSCSTYQSQYDCPPGVGVGCKSVSEIEEMIQEREEGPDLFISTVQSGKGCVSCKSKKVDFSEEAPVVKRVWVSGYSTDSGHRIEGHYVHFIANESKWFLSN